MGKAGFDNAYNIAEQLLRCRGFEEGKDYESVMVSTGKKNERRKETMNLIFVEHQELQKELEGQGWTLASRFVNHGSPSHFCSDLHNNKEELQELIHRHGRQVKMVRMEYCVNIGSV